VFRVLEVPYGCPITLARAQSCFDFSGSPTAKLTLCEKGEANVLNTSEICGTAENSMQKSAIAAYDVQTKNAVLFSSGRGYLNVRRPDFRTR